MAAEDGREGIAAPGGVARILEEARRAAAGEERTPVALIEAPDRDLLRAIKKASPPELDGLLRLFHRVGARGRRVAEQALRREALAPAPALAVLEFLRKRDPRHPLAAAWDGIAAALAAGQPQGAAGRFAELPPALRAAWAECEGLARLTPLDPALAAWLKSDAEAAQAVTAALGRGTPRQSLEALAGLVATSGAKPLAKLVRGAFFRLQQLGVEVPAVEAPAGEAPAPPAAPVERAFLTPVDPAGEQAVYIIEERSDGQAVVLQGILADSGAIAAVRAFQLTRRGLDRLLEGLGADRPGGHAAIGVPEAMALLEDAYALSPESAPRDYRLWRRDREADRRARRGAPVVVGDGDVEDLVAASAELDHDPRLFPWLLDRDEAERAEEVLRDSESRLVLPDSELAERRRDALARAVRAALSPARRQRFAFRLEATARFLARSGDERLARIAAASARRLREVPDASLPLLEAIVEHSLEALAALREERRREREPGQAAAGGGDPQAGQSR